MTDFLQVVDQDSAALGYTGEEDVGLSTNYRDLIRYPDADDDNYDVVIKTIQVKTRLIVEAFLAEQG